MTNWIEPTFLISPSEFGSRGAALEWRKALRLILSKDDNSKKFYLVNPNNTPQAYLKQSMILFLFVLSLTLLGLVSCNKRFF